MSAEMVLWCLQSTAAGCLSKSSGVMAQSLSEDLSLARSPGQQGQDLKDLSRASEAFKNNLVWEMELYTYSGRSQQIRRIENRQCALLLIFFSIAC